MKIFLSWSGQSAGKIASTVSKHIKLIVPGVETFVSAEDIDKGARWSTEIAGELQDSNFGIICLDAKNIRAPWLHFEAGALSKSLKDSKVSPLLFGIKMDDIAGTPLAQFQATEFGQEGFSKLLKDYSKAMSTGVADLTDSYLQKFWPDLEAEVAQIIATDIQEESKSGTIESVESQLKELRQLQMSALSSLRQPSGLLPVATLRRALIAAEGNDSNIKIMQDHIDEADTIISDVASEASYIDEDDPEEMAEKLRSIESSVEWHNSFAEKYSFED